MHRVIFSSFTKLYSTKPVAKPAGENFNVVVKEAEKVVGYPTSFLNLRWLLNDEIANIASHIRKLIHIEHPLVETAKGFLFKNDVPTWGLIVLLVAKAGGLNNSNKDGDIDHTAGILHSQRVLAEVSEMIRTSMLIHRGLLNPTAKLEKQNELFYGNKIALLCGDYLLSKCFHDLANIKDHGVNELISSTLRDLTENEFLGHRDEQNFPVPTYPCAQQSKFANLVKDCDMGPYKVQNILGHCKPEWFLRCILGGANLLGKTCQAACILSRQNRNVKESAFLLGKHMGLAWQAKLDLEMFNRKEFGSYFLVSAPVMWCLSKHPELYELEIAKGAKNVENCDYEKIHEFVLKSNVLQECYNVQNDLILQSQQYLAQFTVSPATESLRDLLKALKL